MKSTVSFLCLALMMLVFFGVLAVHADLCATERSVYESALSAYKAAEAGSPQSPPESTRCLTLARKPVSQPKKVINDVT